MQYDYIAYCAVTNNKLIIRLTSIISIYNKGSNKIKKKIIIIIIIINNARTTCGERFTANNTVYVTIFRF